MRKIYSLLLIGVLMNCDIAKAQQQFLFAQMTGSPTINTTGWNLFGDAAIGDTPGDGDADPNELILTFPGGGGSGAAVFGTPIDLNICNSWTVEFEYRLFDGSGADGLALCFLANPPSGYVTGGGVGIPTAPQGLMVVIDSYDNCGGSNPELQIRYGDGVNNYNECPTPPQPTFGNFTLGRQSNYNTCRVEYENGLIEVFINGTQYLNGYYLTNYVGYLAFTASIGGSNDRHSIRNVNVFTNKPVPDAGPDRLVCSGALTELGTGSTSLSYVYQWTPSTYLDNPTTDTPNFSYINTTGTNQSFTYDVLTYLAGSPGCNNTDQVIVTVEPEAPAPNNCDLQAIRNAFAAAGCTELSGCNPGCSMYFYIPTSYTGGQAQAFAQSLGANLVSIQSPAENQQIVDALNQNGFGGVIWIGFGDETNEGTFSWYDQSQITYTNWDAGEPNNQIDNCCTIPLFGCQGSNPSCNGGEDCTQLRGSGLWNDLPCDEPNNGSVIEVSLCPVITASSDVEICPGSCTTLSASTILGASPYNYTWSDGQTGSTITVCPTQATTYYVTSTGRYGCQVTDSVTVTIHQIQTNAGTDDTICAGESVQLTSGGGDFYQWSPTAGLSDPNIPNPVATPAQTTQYIVTVREAIGNVVANGDFNAGNSGFTSDYSFYTGSPDMGEGRYVVIPNANTIHSGFTGSGYGGSGNFMVVNGAGSPNQDVWCQTVSVNPNTDYNFSTWVSSVAAGSPALLQFSINGSTVGAVFQAPVATNTWQQFFTTWNSGGASTASICIVNQNTSLGGNDFGLDEITFSPVCEGYDTVTITVENPPVIDAGTDTFICFPDSILLQATGNGTSYVWTPSGSLSSSTILNPIARPNTTTQYYLDGFSPIGCQSRDSVTITVELPPVIDAGPGDTICINDTYQLLATGNAATYVWSPSTGLSSTTIVNPAATPTATLTYLMEGFSALGCRSEDSVTISVELYPVIDAGGDITICFGGDTALQATGNAYSYQWSPGTSLNSTTILNPISSTTATITYTLNAYSYSGCLSTDNVVVTVNSLPIVSINGLLPGYCSDNGLVNLTGSPLGGVWSGVGVIGTQFDPSVVTSSQSIIQYTYTDANNCTDSIDQQVTVYQLPTVSFLNIDSTFCIDDAAYILPGNPPGGNYWGTGVNFTSFVPTTAGIGQHIINYRYADNNGCDDTVQTTLTVVDLPASEIFTTDLTCYDIPDGEVFVMPTSGASPYSFVWSPAATDDSLLTNLDIGLYSVTITDANGCTFATSAYISEPSPLEVEIDATNDSVLLGQSTVFSVLSNGPLLSGYAWTPADSLSCSDCATPVASPQGNNLYEVLVTDENGCTASDTIFIFLKPDKITYIPNAFSPNGDGNNDIYRVLALGIKEFRLIIFNRWGEKLFESRDAEEGWDGSYSGKMMNPDVYIYDLSILFWDNEYVEKKGSITLLK